ncbi:MULTISPECIES: HAMP domain-containing sensor histidine kinase [Spirulina sp. CCY15215]|uniref:sensor histidine kinase n=1 Tax=Spirulina sp. CCY15215 TaxID=2767591 RepID=UPI001950EFF4|nr:HAMP domain-containing sensor histidine kinase [Spirulina major]
MSEELETLKAELERTKLAYQMAAQMGLFKSGFLARTSHELRSPLNSLLGLHQLILADLCESPEEEREFVEQAHKAALKLIKLLDDIIYVSKAEQGSKYITNHPFPLSEVFNELKRLTHLHAANRSYDLNITYPEPELYINADLKRFAQVLVSLVDTAIAYMEEGAIAITVRTSPQGDIALVWIDIESCQEIWQEPIDLLKKQPLDVDPKAVQSLLQTPVPSPGMNLLLSQCLLETMGGGLEILQAPSPREENPLTRVQCSIPLASAQMIEEAQPID